MTDEPIRSAMDSVSTEDTSLVLPSDKKQHTGQQRVLEQVKSIKRSKSKMVKSGSLPSPSTPSPATEFSEPKFQFSPGKLNGTSFKFSESSMMTSQRATGRSLSLRKSVRSQNQRESLRSLTVKSQSNGMKASGNGFGGRNTQKSMRSSTVRYNRTSVQSMMRENNPLVSASQSQSINIKPSSIQSQTVSKATITRSKSEGSGAYGATVEMPDMTLEEAVKKLTLSDESSQLLGASFIQHQTFAEDKAKEEVWRLAGIPALIQLLKSDNLQLQQTAASALRNTVFKDTNNKLEVEKCEGIEAILTLLRNTNVAETQKQLTGLLWNLSSAEELKPELIENAMPLLTESILVPYSFETDIYTSKLVDPEVFYNTTGCFRNLSCASEKERISMRNCTGLIDSLVTYVQTHLDRGDSDDKSVENCVCILHNLSYQLEKEAPDHFPAFATPDVSPHANKSSQSIFSPKRTKTQKVSFPAMEVDKPKGVNWLYHQKSLQLYLSLLSCSQKEATLEACCGALQNLTASKSPVSTVISETIIEKLYGLPIISPLLNSANLGLQKTAMSLVGNISRVASLRSAMATEILPRVSSMVSSVTPKMVESDSSISTACRVMHTLMMAEPNVGKTMLNQKLIDSLSALSSNVFFEKARKDAGVLLWSLWREKDFQNVLKKQGMNKDTFKNAVTATAYQGVQAHERKLSDVQSRSPGEYRE
ncbi:plakophilin-1 [Pimephales promelas]|uniref:plakophilin-1 n=1 Tax=Pimephales promelas TaxID=90988 RepID=UPI001955B664|nr:plakophilin-1 [Pimephales promelas]KAG1941956.1 plakophilin-3 [Pimephales promelas]